MFGTMNPTKSKRKFIRKFEITEHLDHILSTLQITYNYYPALIIKSKPIKKLQ
jgi:hypothetical protein